MVSGEINVCQLNTLTWPRGTKSAQSKSGVSICFIAVVLQDHINFLPAHYNSRAELAKPLALQLSDNCCWRRVH